MDLRVIKSKKSIHNAYMELRKNKQLHKITVKELCEKAMINKSTFYTYYEDIFDLSDKIETEIVNSVVNSISEPANILQNPASSVKELFNAFVEKAEPINIVFSGDSQSNLIGKITKVIKETVYDKYPEYRNDLSLSVILDYTIFGGYYTYEQNISDENDSLLINSYIATIAEHIQTLINNRENIVEY